MTDRELLELVLQKVTTIETEVSSLKTDVNDVKANSFQQAETSGNQV